MNKPKIRIRFLYLCIMLMLLPRTSWTLNKKIVTMFDTRQGQNVQVVADEVIIKLKNEKSEQLLKGLHRQLESDVIGEIPELNCQLIRISKKLPILKAIEVYQQDSQIEFAEPNYVAHLTTTPPNDPHYTDQWYLPHINAEAAWELEQGSANIIIGIIDSGLDFAQGDFAGKIWTNPGEIPDDGIDNDNNGYVDDVHGWDFTTMTATNKGDNEPIPTPNGEDDDNDGHSDEASSHGTHVAGIASARTNNGLGIAGIAGEVQVLPVRIFDDEENCGESWIITHAFLYTGQTAQIINCSFSVARSDLVSAAIQYLYNHNCVIVASAGNAGVNLDNQFRSPVCNDGQQNMVLGVAATDQGDRRSIWNSLKSSNFSSNFVDVSAPGTNIFSTLFYDPAVQGFSDKYGSKSGTSMATPIVSGLAALVWSQHPDWSNRQVMDRIISTAVNIDALNPGFAGQLGAGRVDLFAALNTEPLVASLSCQASPSAIQASGSSTAIITSEIRDQNGNLITSATNPITFTITAGSASAQLVGANPVIPVNGEATISLQSTTIPGVVVVNATSPGLTTGTVTINVYDDPTEVGGAISQSTTWTLEGSPYVVTSDIVVNAGVILTIEPGVTVKFNRDRDLWVYGAMAANGTPGRPILFTANAENPYPKYWGGIRFFNSNLDDQSILNYCTISYGGQGDYGNCDTPLRINAYTNPTFTNITMIHNNRNGVDLDATEYSSDILLDITDLPYILRGHLTLKTGATLTIKPGVLMKMERGSDFVIYGGFNAAGTPENHIIFTSMRDDSHGGDTNGDGVTFGTPGDWGGIGFDHSIIDANTRLEYCEIYYGGQGGYGNHDCPLELHPYANPSMSNIQMANNKLNGIDLGTGTYASDLILDITCLPYILRGDLVMSAGATMTIQPGVLLKFKNGSDFYIDGGLTARGTADNHIIFTSLRDDSHGGDTDANGSTTGSVGEWGGIWFDDKVTDKQCVLEYCDIMYAGCGGYGHLESPLAIDARANPTFSNLTLTDNRRNGIDVATADYASDIHFDILELPYMIRGDLTVESSATLEIDPGVILKFTGGADFYIKGALKARGTPENQIVFTSYKDDAHGGDTNGDGGSVGTKGYWGGIRLYDSNIDKSSILEYCTILYSGCGGYGHNDTPLVLDGRANPTISNMTLAENTRNGIRLYTGHYSADFYLDIIDLPYIIRGDVVVDSPAKLSIHPGVVIKLEGRSDLWIDGALDVRGTAEQPIILTSLRDDSIGGDSNGDGSSAASPGDWGGIRFRDSSDDNLCVVDHLQLLYGGCGDYGNNESPLSFDNANPKVQNVTIANSKFHGATCYQSASPDLGGGVHASTGGNQFYNFKNVGNKYAIYNKGSTDIYARLNYWDTNDSTQIEQNIFDKMDDRNKGRVYFNPFNSAEDIRAPQVTLLQPNGGEQWIVGAQKSISWTATDNDAVSKIYLLISRNGGTTFTLFDSLNSNPGLKPWQVTGPFSNYCQIKVMAVDAAGNTGVDVSDGNFAIIDTTGQVNHPPTAPSVLLPANGEEAQPGDYLVWTKSVDPDVGDVVTYTLELDNNSDFSSPEIHQAGIPGEPVTNNSDPPHLQWDNQLQNSNAVFIRIIALQDYVNLQDNVTYFWRVQAVDNYDTHSDFTNGTSSFFFNKTNSPPLAVLKGFSPKDGLEVRTGTPEISWHPASDPDPGDHAGTLHYLLQLDEDGEFVTNFRFQYTTAVGLNTFEVPQALTENVNWFYRVQAVDAGGLTGPWSETQDFWINAVDEPPTAFALKTPANNQVIFTDSVRFVWSQSFDVDPVDELTFTLEYCGDSNFRENVFSHTGISDTTFQLDTQNLPLSAYYWRVKAVDSDGLLTWGSSANTNPWIFRLNPAAVDSKAGEAIPTEFALSQNYPNPFNPQTNIEFQLPEPAAVSLKIINLKGQVIRELLSGQLNAGIHHVVWNGKDARMNDVAGGIYFYVLKAGNFTQCRKLLLIR